jgi:hypothetical protein
LSRRFAAGNGSEDKSTHDPSPTKCGACPLSQFLDGWTHALLYPDSNPRRHFV